MKIKAPRITNNCLPCSICSLGVVAGQTYSYCSECTNCYAHPNCLYNLFSSEDNAMSRNDGRIYCRYCNAKNVSNCIRCNENRCLAIIQYIDGICNNAIVSLFILIIACATSLLVGYGLLTLAGLHSENTAPNYTDFAVGAVIVPFVVFFVTVLVNRNTRALLATLCCLPCRKCSSCCKSKRTHII